MKSATTSGTLRDLLRERGLTFDAAGVLAGVDTSVISRMVNGKRQARPETIVRLARVLGISARRLQQMADAAYAAEHDADRGNEGVA
jgi:plasmid maintenance system antidote protein VapI